MVASTSAHSPVNIHSIPPQLDFRDVSEGRLLFPDDMQKDKTHHSLDRARIWKYMFREYACNPHHSLRVREIAERLCVACRAVRDYSDIRPA